MTWKIRHEGSPRSIEGLGLPQVVEGLQDGLWETTDEVMGPSDRQWIAIENHPQLAEIAADIEPPQPRGEDDETRLDMNPLIDVSLVLLIFFILTTSYAALQKLLEMPKNTSRNPAGQLVFTPEKVKNLLIKVELRKNPAGAAEILIEDQIVPENELVAAFRRLMKDTQKSSIVIFDKGAEWGTSVAVQDAAKEAGVERAYLGPSTVPIK